MAYINDWNTLILARSQVKKIGGTSLKKYCLTDTKDEVENKRRKRLLEEYSDKNEISIEKVSYGSGKRVWWKCKECGYVWETIIKNRTVHKQGCPKCAGKVTSEKNSLLSFIEANGKFGEQLRKEYSSKNEKTLEEISYGSHERVLWKCSKCGYEWETIIKNRTVHKCGCPKCAGKVISDENSLLGFIEKNGEYGEKLRKEYSDKNVKSLEEVSYASSKKVIWKCLNCKKEWMSTISHRTDNIRRGCPFCNKWGTSFPEQLIFYILKRELSNYEVFNRDKSEGREIDVYIPSLKFGVEYDGWFYHKERQDKDKEKYKFFQDRDLDIIRIIGKENDEPVGVKCNLEYNTTKDLELIEARDYIKNYLYEHYNIKIDISMTEDEIEECKREARKQIEDTLGGFSLNELNIPEDEEFEYLPSYL